MGGGLALTRIPLYCAKHQNDTMRSLRTCAAEIRQSWLCLYDGHFLNIVVT